MNRLIPTQLNPMILSPPLKQKRFRRILLINLIAPVSMVIALGAIFTVIIFHLLSGAQSVDHTDQVIARTNKVLRFVVDAETGVRGYLISGKADFLVPFTRAKEAIGPAISELRALVADNPEQQQYLDGISKRFHNWLEYARKVTEMKHQNLNYQGYVAEEHGKSITDAIRADIYNFSEEELNLRNQLVQALAFSTKVSIFAVWVFSLAIALIIVMSGRRQLLSLSLEYNEILSQLDEEKAILVAKEESLRVAKNEAEQAVRVRDEFLSVASHELKTPLTSLSLQLQLFNRAIKKSLAGVSGPPGAEKQEMVFLPLKTTEIVAKCVDQSKRLTTLLDELLDLTRIRLGRIQLAKEDVDLGGVVKSVAERFRVEATQKGSEVSVFVEQPVVGHWDLMRIEQIVTNLISNAVKYGEGKGISVTVSRDNKSGCAKVVVKDHGMGIPVELQGQIFERFERARAESRKIPGLGLGLYICRQVVQAHGGVIRVESEEGKGATFVVELPLGVAGESNPKAQAS